MPVDVVATMADDVAQVDRALLRPDDGTMPAASADNSLRESLRQSRGSRDGDASRSEGLTGASDGIPRAGLPPSARREQQINIEERTGQSFAEPHEHGRSGRPSPGSDLFGPPSGIDDGRDIGL